MSDIVGFLNARIAEDEADATNAPEGAEGVRLSAECAAKRAIVKAHPVMVWEGVRGQEVHECMNCEMGSQAAYDAPCDSLAALAAVYNAHPDYDGAWAL